MKQLFKYSKFILAALITASMATACVEQEQNPLEDETENNGGNDNGGGNESNNGSENGNDDGTTGGGTTLEAQLPDPNAISFIVGDEVIIKGSGLSNSDEIYLRNMENEYGTDANGDGIDGSFNVKAEIKECTSEELVFIVPEELDPNLTYSYEANVYLRRNGEETKLGFIRLGYIDFKSNEIDEQSLEFSIARHDRPLNTEGNLYLQYFDVNEENHKIKLTGSPIYIKEEYIKREEYKISAKYEYGLGDLKVIYVLNGEKQIVGDLHFPYEVMAEIDIPLTIGNENFIGWPGFNENDELFITDYSHTREYHLITRFADNGAYITIPTEYEGSLNEPIYELNLRREGQIFTISENIDIKKQ